MFDLAKRQTLEECELWKKDVEDKVFLKDGQPIPCLLVGNKVRGHDLTEDSARFLYVKPPCLYQPSLLPNCFISCKNGYTTPWDNPGGVLTRSDPSNSTLFYN